MFCTLQIINTGHAFEDTDTLELNRPNSHTDLQVTYQSILDDNGIQFEWNEIIQ